MGDLDERVPEAQSFQRRCETMAEPTLRQLLQDSERMAAAAEAAASKREEPNTPFERAFSLLEQVIETARAGRDERLRSLAAAFGAMTRAVGTMLDRTENELQTLRATVARLEGTTNLSDLQYRGFEERFRGDYQDVLRRHEVYRPWLEELATRHPAGKVFEIGPGRGEMARLVSDSGFKWHGVDANVSQVAVLKSKGFDARSGDGWHVLADEPEESLAAIVALHVIEHVPFQKVIELFQLAAARLEPGGLLILETPNWRSLLAALNFYLDPTHLRPVDGRLLEFIAAEHGFSVLLCQGVEPLAPLQKVPPDAAHAAVYNGNIDRLNQLLLDGQDLVFVARRG